jgi:hypothetical protein
VRPFASAALEKSATDRMAGQARLSLTGNLVLL